MRATYISACIVGALVLLWLASGQLGEEHELPAQSIAEQNRRVALLAEEKPLTRVRISTIHATEQNRVLSVRGRTESKRAVVIQSQIDGLLEARPVERGDKVTTGDLLCRITVENRRAALAEAMATVEQARIEYEGSQRLSRQGLQSETMIAQAKARLASAEANLDLARLAQARLEIRAPFDGVIEDVHLEQGQYIKPGSDCVTLVDLDPMLLIGNITENELPFVYPGLLATAVLPSGREISGEVTFVARTADPSTRTYAIEAQVPNRDGTLPSGVTAAITIPVETLLAQKISPALLVLDDQGRMGVRALDELDVVQFHEVRIVRDESDGIWVTGLPDVARIITVGQQLVVAGEKVDPTHQPLSLVGVEEKDGEAL